MNNTKTSQPGKVEPYLFFDGKCNEALEFYRKVLGAEILMLMRYKESPDPTMCMPGIDPQKVMHASIRVGESTLLASDGRCTGKPKFEGFALSFSVANEADGRRVFAALSEGGQVEMPLAKTFFAHLFGMVTDRFGITWMIIHPIECRP